MKKYTGVVFCGGYGTRMSAHDSILPKSLVSVAGSTIIDVIIDIFKSNGIDRILLLTGYKSIYFEKKFLGNKDVHVINTGVGTETGHRLFLASEFLVDGPFVLTYGDSIVSFNLDAALKQINKKYGVAAYEKTINYGVFDFDRNDNVNKLYEKDFKVKINAGYYILDQDFFKVFPDYVNKSFEKDFLPELINLGLISTYDVKFWEPLDSGDDIKSFDYRYTQKNIKPWICI